MKKKLLTIIKHIAALGLIFYCNVFILIKTVSGILKFLAAIIGLEELLTRIYLKNKKNK